MTRTRLGASCLLSLIAATASAAGPSIPKLSAEQIVEKNVAARGGLAAWRAVATLKTEGEMDAGGKPNHQLPFVLRQKRPHQSRLEIVFKDQTSVQVYDGHEGWKVRPFLNRNEVEPLTPAEARIEAAADELDGPLVDYATKGTQIALVGTESVEGHPAYKLRLTRRGGEPRHVWIDAHSFLELKTEGEPRKLDGKMHNVAVYLRDYRPEHGLLMPHLQETAVDGVKQTYKMTISKVAVNEPMDDALFQKPQVGAAPGPAKP